MKNLTILSGIIAVFCLLNCNSVLDDAEKFYDNREYLKVISILKDKHDEKSELLKINSYINLGDYQRVISILKTNHKPQSDTVNFLLAQAYYKMKDYKESLVIMDSLILRNPTDIKYYVSKFKVLANLEEYDKALELINKGLSYFPNDHRLILYKGIARYFLYDFKGAKIDIETFLNSRLEKDKKDLSNAHRMLAHIYDEVNDVKNFEDNLLKAYEYEVELNDYLYKEIASFYITNGDTVKGCKFLREAMDKGSSDALIIEDIRKYCN